MQSGACRSPALWNPYPLQHSLIQHPPMSASAAASRSHVPHLASERVSADRSTNNDREIRQAVSVARSVPCDASHEPHRCKCRSVSRLERSIRFRARLLTRAECPPSSDRLEPGLSRNWDSDGGGLAESAPGSQRRRDKCRGSYRGEAIARISPASRDVRAPSGPVGTPCRSPGHRRRNAGWRESRSMRLRGNSGRGSRSRRWKSRTR